MCLDIWRCKMLKVVHSGVYFLYDGEELVYIGQSDNIYRRIGQHIYEAEKKFDSFCFYPAGEERIILESYLINKFHPKYNLTCGSTVAPWCGYAPKDDIFPDTMPDEKVIAVINECLAGKPKGIPLRKIARKQNFFNENYVVSQMIKNREQLHVYKLDGTWYIDSEWYVKNERRFWEILKKW